MISAIVSILIAMCFYIVLVYKTRVRNIKPIKKVVLFVVLFLIILVRVYNFWETMGLDLDEAMGGYNAWSLMKYGVDQHGNHLPIYLYAWGSGMNALYPYLTIPFIKILGLSIFSYRLPMVVMSIFVAFYLVYALLRTDMKVSNIILLMTVLFLSPSMITSSRWAVESNIFPSLMVFELATFILFNKEKRVIQRKLLFILYSIILGISAYAYSSNWIYLACSTVVIYVWLLKSRKINLREVLIGIGTVTILVWPLILFMYVNYVSHNQIHILGLTITELAVSRGNSQFILDSNNIVGSLFNNLKNAIVVLVNGNDGMVRLALPFFGAFYPMFLMFGVVGILKKVSQGFGILDKYMLVILCSSIPTILLVVPNYTHFNALFVPILYFEYVGISSIFVGKIMNILFSALMAIMLISFSYSYLYTNADTLKYGGIEVATEFKDALKFSHTVKNKKIIVITSYGESAYIVPMFYDKVSPYIFNKTKQKIANADHMYYSYYSNYRFYSIPPTKVNSNNVYIIQNNLNYKVSNLNEYKEENFGIYTVYYK
ncbi:hypothetical protein [Ligilactobacillus equi]